MLGCEAVLDAHHHSAHAVDPVQEQHFCPGVTIAKDHPATMDVVDAGSRGFCTAWTKDGDRDSRRAFGTGSAVLLDLDGPSRE